MSLCFSLLPDSNRPSSVKIHKINNNIGGKHEEGRGQEVKKTSEKNFLICASDYYFPSTTSNEKPMTKRPPHVLSIGHILHERMAGQVSMMMMVVVIYRNPIRPIFPPKYLPRRGRRTREGARDFHSFRLSASDHLPELWLFHAHQTTSRPAAIVILWECWPLRLLSVSLLSLLNDSLSIPAAAPDTAAGRK